MTAREPPLCPLHVTRDMYHGVTYDSGADEGRCANANEFSARLQGVLSVYTRVRARTYVCVGVCVCVEKEIVQLYTHTYDVHVHKIRTLRCVHCCRQ